MRNWYLQCIECSRTVCNPLSLSLSLLRSAKIFSVFLNLKTSHFPWIIFSWKWKKHDRFWMKAIEKRLNNNCNTLSLTSSFTSFLSFVTSVLSPFPCILLREREREREKFLRTFSRSRTSKHLLTRFPSFRRGCSFCSVIRKITLIYRHTESFFFFTLSLSLFITQSTNVCTRFSILPSRAIFPVSVFLPVLLTNFINF